MTQADLVFRFAKPAGEPLIKNLASENGLTNSDTWNVLLRLLLAHM